MERMKHPDLAGLYTLQSFKGKPIINVINGEQLGSVDELMVHPDNMQLAAVGFLKGGLLRQDLYAVPASEVRVWGKDTVLVNTPDLVRKKKDQSELKNTVSAAEAARYRPVISLDGERNGELKDFLIDQNGRFEGIEVTRISAGLANLKSVKGRSSQVRLPVHTIHSLGKDAIIIDLVRVEQVLDAAPDVELPVEEQLADIQPVEQTVEEPYADEPQSEEVADSVSKPEEIVDRRE